MSIRETLKRNPKIRRAVKRLKNYREFMADANDFSNYYEESAEKHGDYRYRLMLYVHNLEKGLSRSDPRPFGREKAAAVVEILKRADERKRSLFEYRLAVSALKQWREFHLRHHWEIDSALSEEIDGFQESDLRAGAELFTRPSAALEQGSFFNIVSSRRSVRDFKDAPLRQEDVDFALRCFSAAPTACNRQMCRVYLVKKPEFRALLFDTILGIGGFNQDTTSLFLFTYDVSAFEFYGERNQGYLNVGLAAMNFANALHARGIGSCFMQWSNNRKDDKMIRRALGIPSSERIGVILGAGYYKDAAMIPVSTRKNKELVYSVL